MYLRSYHVAFSINYIAFVFICLNNDTLLSAIPPVKRYQTNVVRSVIVLVSMY
jgi:hypothetical protein